MFHVARKIRGRQFFGVGSAVLGKAISAVGVSLFQLLLARASGESAVGQFASALSVFILIGILARWGGAELLFRDAQVIENESGRGARNYYIRRIMLHTLGRAILLTFGACGISFAILPEVGLYGLVAAEYPFLWLIPPFFALTAINANYNYFRGKNFVAAFFEPGGVAFIASLIVLLGLALGAGSFGSATPLVVYASTAAVLCVAPLIGLLFNSEKSQSATGSERSIATQFLQASIVQYLGQWGIVAVLGAVQSPRSVAVFAVCLQISVALNFLLRVAHAVFSHKIRFLYETEPGKDFAVQFQKINRAIGLVSLSVFMIGMAFAESIYEIFGFTDRSFYYVFFALMTARLINNLFGMTEDFMKMTYFQKEFKWILAGSSAIAFGAGCFGAVVSIEVVASFVALSIVINNLLCSWMIFRRTGLLMLPLTVRMVERHA